MHCGCVLLYSIGKRLRQSFWYHIIEIDHANTYHLIITIVCVVRVYLVRIFKIEILGQPHLV